MNLKPLQPQKATFTNESSLQLNVNLPQPKNLHTSSNPTVSAAQPGPSTHTEKRPQHLDNKL